MVNPRAVEPPVEPPVVKERAGVALLAAAVVKMERERDEAQANVAMWQGIADERQEALDDLHPTLEALRKR